MSLDLALSVSTGGLANVSRQIAIVSQNIANASTPGYVDEISTQTSSTAAGQGDGVRTGIVTRDVNATLQAGSLAQNSVASGLQTTHNALSAIDGVIGAPGSGTDLGSLLGALSNDLSTLANDPSNQTQQDAVVTGASILAQGINALAGTYTAQRQSAQDSIVSDVATLNATLGTIGALSNQIVALKTQGLSTADLENQRDAAIQTISQITDVRVLGQENGDVTLFTGSGVSLPIHGQSSPFATSGATLGPGAFYPAGGLPGITLDGTDVTRQLTGGRIGANIALRDTVLPTAQAQLDEFSQTLATRFAAQGLPLFTRPDGTVPAGGGAPVQSTYVGFSSDIGVNPAITANPAGVRDGVPSLNTTGAVGFTGVVTNVLDYALGADQSAGVPQPAVNVAGLGPSGALSAPYASPADLAGFAGNLSTALSNQSAETSDQLATATALQTSLTTKLSSQTGVNIDSELANLTQLQNAYGANAKVLTAVQSLYTALLAAVVP